jgi:hypothetical protein
LTKDGAAELLEGKEDVNESGYVLDGAVVLGVVDKVTDAGKQVGVPFEDVKLVGLVGLEVLSESKVVSTRQ